MTYTFQVMFAVIKHTLIKVIRRPVVLTFSFFQPLMWMFFFGFLFYRFPLDQLGKDISYIDFLLPGICCMTTLFGASQSGISIVRDIQSGFLFRLLRTPASRGAILLGKISADVIRLLFQVMIVIIIGNIIGVSYNITLIGLVQGVIALIFFAFAYASLSCFIAIKAKEPEVMGTFIHIVNMPILFTSTALVPGKQMPEWLEGISSWNPLSIVADCFRESLIFNGTCNNTSNLILLFLLAIFLFGVDVISFKKIKIE